MLCLKQVLNINKILHVLSAVLVLTHVDIYVHLIWPFWWRRIPYIHFEIGRTSIDFAFACL